MIANQIMTTEVLMARLRNLIPTILKDREMTITDLQLKSGLGWPTVHKVANEKTRYIPDRTSIRTLQAIAGALEIEVSDLYEVESAES